MSNFSPIKKPIFLLCAIVCAFSANAETSVVFRDLQQLENERDRAIQKRELDAMRDQTSTPKEVRVTHTKLPTGNFQFVLKKLSHTGSDVLTNEEIAQAVAPWIDTIVNAETLAQMIDAINHLYREKGYAVCQAALRPQRIRDGHLMVTLIEGKTDEVVIRGLNNTKDAYVARAFDMSAGQVANYRDMYANLVRFNMTNDIHLSIDIQAGDKPETTRYEIHAQEPTQWTASLSADSLGSESSGRYRIGASVANRSVFGYRDSMYLMGIASEGSKSLLWGYSVPLDSFGTRLIANVSAGKVEVVDGPSEANDISGESFSASLRLEHPFIVSETSKQIAFAEYGYQTSQTDMFTDVTVAKTQIDKADFGLDSLFLGETWQMYLSNRLSHHWAKEKLFLNQYDYWVYSGDVYAQAFLTNRFSLLGTASWQAKLSGDEILSSDQFYLGQSAGVRGYPNDVISAENGVWVNFEAQYRLADGFKTFVFVDLGRLSGTSAYEKSELYSTGLGFNWQPVEWAQLKATMGIPLTRQITDQEKVDRVRFDATLNLVY